jgi:hypothetical protein
MSPGIWSTSRPSTLRLVGFLSVVIGSAAAGIGATREWAAIGFAADVQGAADVSVFGTDVVDGKVILLGAGIALVATLAMRLARSARVRKALGVLLIVLGIVCVVLTISTAVRARARFGGEEGLDRAARVLSQELRLPEDIVREQLAEQFEQDLRVEVQPALWLCALGGALMAAGGVLGLAWTRRRDEATV